MGMCLPCLSGEAVDYDDGQDPVSIYWKRNGLKIVNLIILKFEI